MTTFQTEQMRALCSDAYYGKRLIITAIVISGIGCPCRRQVGSTFLFTRVAGNRVDRAETARLACSRLRSHFAFCGLCARGQGNGVYVSSPLHAGSVHVFLSSIFIRDCGLLVLVSYKWASIVFM